MAAFFNIQGWMAADLLECGQQSEYRSLLVYAVLLFEPLLGLFYNLLVQDLLLECQVRITVGYEFFRQVVDDRFVGFHPSKHQGGCDGSEGL